MQAYLLRGPEPILIDTAMKVTKIPKFNIKTHVKLANSCSTENSLTHVLYIYIKSRFQGYSA